GRPLPDTRRGRPPWRPAPGMLSVDGREVGDDLAGTGGDEGEEHDRRDLPAEPVDGAVGEGGHRPGGVEAVDAPVVAAVDGGGPALHPAVRAPGADREVVVVRPRPGPEVDRDVVGGIGGAGG